MLAGYQTYSKELNIVIITIYPFTARVVGAPQMISQPVSSNIVVLLLRSLRLWHVDRTCGDRSRRQCSVSKFLLSIYSEAVTSFKYLGSVITDEGSKPEILSRIAQTTAALTRLKPV